MRDFLWFNATHMSNLLGLGEEPDGDLALEAGLAPDPEWAIKAKGGANWFYWIAALSLINSLAFVMDAQFHFLAGLGMTEIADGLIAASIEQGAPSAIKAFSIVFDSIFVIGFALAGYYAGRLFLIAFIAGICVYVFDAFVVLLLGDFLMAGFHAFALFFIVRGFLACRKLKAFEKANSVINSPPPPPAFA